MARPLWHKALAPQDKREAVSGMVNDHQLSERHACALVGLSRDSYRHPGTPSSLNEELLGKIVQTAPPVPGINHKRVYRLYSQEGLAIRKRKKTKRIGMRLPLVVASALNQTWSMDFVSDAIARPGAIARRIKCLTVADDFSHECVESFNGTFRDECLDENWFESLHQARQAIHQWRKDYNEIRPHSSIGGIPPAQFAALNRQLTGDSAQAPSNHDTIK